MATTAAKQYQGKPISLNFQDIPVRTVLQIIADFNNLNLVTTDSVSGNITLRLDGVPWEQALDIILKVRGLDKRLDNNILLVAPADEIAAREKQQMESRNQVADLAPSTPSICRSTMPRHRKWRPCSPPRVPSCSPPEGRSAWMNVPTCWWSRTRRMSSATSSGCWISLDIPVKQVVIEARMVTIDDGSMRLWGALG